MMKNNISSLYVHIPFCESICNYCDFPKLQYFRFLAEQYLDALEKEIKDVVKNKDLETIYVGGGTPTVLEDDLFLKLLEMLKPYSLKVKEYTFEANPESLNENKIKMMKEYGVNRVSIGVESTDNKILSLINRKHTFEDVQKCVENLKKYRLDNFNVDLILGLPNVTKGMLKNDLDNLLSLDPKHISTYSLTVHPNTMFYINKINEPEDDISRELYDLVHETLTKHGYIHYEVSNFAKEGYESKHNFVYWKNKRYYGVGLASAGYIDNVRYKNTSNFDKYIKGINEKEEEYLSLKDEREYCLMLLLRTNQGISLKEYTQKYNKDLYLEKKKEIEEFISNGLLEIKDDRLVATYQGMMVLDQIIIALY